MTPEEIIVRKCLGLKKNERFLIVTDKIKEDLAEQVLSAAEKIAISDLISIPVAKINGEEPPVWAAKKMLEFDVIVLMPEKSLSHTTAREQATKKGARIASMPNVTRDILDRVIDVDYEEMSKTTRAIADILDKGGKVRVLTELGTDIIFDIDGRKASGRDTGIYIEKGAWGNLPTGEAFIAPVESKSSGTYIVDGSHAGIGILELPIKFTVVDGFAVKILGDREAMELRKQLESVKNKNAYNIAEFGIGTNPNAKVTGNIIEDEKSLGTCHIALGNNSGFGGKVNVPIHVDGVITRPTIFVDDKKLVDRGELLI